MSKAVLSGNRPFVCVQMISTNNMFSAIIAAVMPLPYLKALFSVEYKKFQLRICLIAYTIFYANFYIFIFPIPSNSFVQTNSFVYNDHLSRPFS